MCEEEMKHDHHRRHHHHSTAHHHDAAHYPHLLEAALMRFLRMYM